MRTVCHERVCLSARWRMYLNKCSALAEVGDRFATIDMCRKLGAVPLLGGESWVPT